MTKCDFKQYAIFQFLPCVPFSGIKVNINEYPEYVENIKHFAKHSRTKVVDNEKIYLMTLSCRDKSLK